MICSSGNKFSLTSGQGHITFVEIESQLEGGVSMSSEERTFEKYLHAQGLKFTPQRRRVLNTIFSTRDHFEADDLVSASRQGGNTLSRATVYRTLPLLVRCGLIREVQFGENPAHYEHTFGREHHDHMICIRCGEVVEFYDESIEQLQDTVCAAHDFQVQTHNLEIKGYCGRCRKSFSGEPSS